MKWARQRTELTLEGAERLLWCALDYSAEQGAAVAIAVVDPAGYLLCSARMDGAPGVSSGISADKARTAAQLRTATRQLQETVDRRHASYLSIASLCPVSGGVPVVLEGDLIGALGVSGGTEAVDHDLAHCAAEQFLEQLAGERPKRPAKEGEGA